MKVGLLWSFRNPPQWRRPWNAFYAEQIDQAVLSEELGYDHIWLTEHHFSPDGYSPSLMPIAGTLAARTSRIRIGTFLVLLPLHDARHVAEDAATVDILSNGRLDLGLGQGYVPSEFERFEVDRTQRGSLLEEGVEVIRGMWTQESFSYDGDHYKFEDLQMQPRPVQEPPPLWIGARGKRAVRRVARLGCHFLGVSEPKGQELYDETLIELGHTPADFFSTQLQWAYCAPTTDEAWADCQEHLHHLLFWYQKWASEGADSIEKIQSDTDAALPSPEKLRASLDQSIPGVPLVGTPDEVAAGLERFTKSMRMTHLVIGMHFPGIDPAKSRRSMTLFAKEVLPSLR